MPDSGQRLTLLLGGARSGKSSHAEQLVARHPAPWLYIATAQALDAEMTERIAAHRGRRGEGWETLEAPFSLAETLAEAPAGRPVLVDCLTLWLSNLMLGEWDVEVETERLAEVLSRPRGPWFVVSNEVGMGVVPDNPLGRRFRDAQGRLNARVAALADEVLLMVAGLPMKVK